VIAKGGAIERADDNIGHHYVDNHPQCEPIVTSYDIELVMFGQSYDCY